MGEFAGSAHFTRGGIAVSSARKWIVGPIVRMAPNQEILYPRAIHFEEVRQCADSLGDEALIALLQQRPRCWSTSPAGQHRRPPMRPPGRKRLLLSMNESEVPDRPECRAKFHGNFCHAAHFKGIDH